MNFDEQKLNKFLSLDWPQFKKTIQEIGEKIKALEKIVTAFEQLEEIRSFYECLIPKELHLGDYFDDLEREGFIK